MVQWVANLVHWELLILAIASPFHSIYFFNFSNVILYFYIEKKNQQHFITSLN